MHRWWGSASDSAKQASERDNRQARRTISRFPQIPDSSEDEYEDCNLSTSFIPNLDGADDASSGTSTPHSPSSPVRMAPPIKFEDETGEDDIDYYKKVGTLAKRVFNPKQVEFWFTSFETSLRHIGVKSQWAKRESLHNLLPDEVQVSVMHILKKDQTTAEQ